MKRDTNVMWRCATVALMGIGCLVASSGALHAQQIDGQGDEEVRQLAEATALERNGDLDGAQQVLETLLSSHPNSVSALLTYERILQKQGRLALLVPAVTRMLEVEPGSAIAHQLRVRTLSALDRSDELDQAAEAWIDAMGDREIPYREIAQVYIARGDPARAVSVLERGRDRLGRRDALALEIGEALVALGDFTGAAREWAVAVGPDGKGYHLVRRRLTEQDGLVTRVAPFLIAALTEGDPAPARLRAAVDLAIEAGRGDLAEPAAQAVAGRLDGEERRRFLRDVARGSENANLPSLAFWAYGQLLDMGATGQELVTIHGRMGELALALGDTAAARRHFGAVEASAAPGTPERKAAAAAAVDLVARAGRADEALARLERFRAEYPNAPELDALVASVGGLLLHQGDVAAAEELVRGASGAPSQALEARIALYRGELERARRSFLSAAPGLRGAEATEAIALATLLGRVSPEGGKLLGRFLVLADRGDVDGAISLLRGEGGTLTGAERAALLDFAAGVADRAGFDDHADKLRRIIVAEHAESREAPAALLELARSALTESGGRDEARHLLERLILEHPRSALVPHARQELARLRGAE